jgi:hypothetical protein
LIKPIENWLSRHKNYTSFWLHMIGIPACFVACPIFFILGQWWLGGCMFLGGYALQFIGHIIEGNRSGEEMFVRRLLHMESENVSHKPRKKIPDGRGSS